MKETIKASIGGYVFTLDKDAYDTLKVYLDNIRIHFENKTDGDEIISDIEYRMCELLQMKVNKTESIVTISDAKSIIEIMGNPIDFEDKDPEQKPIADKSQSIRKKFYRNKGNSILGGVCSGLGQYFHLDPVIIRLGLVVSIILGKIIDTKVGGLIILAYIMLWVVTPLAKTMTQKLAMSGNNPTIEGIETGTAKVKRSKGSLLGRGTLKLIKIICSIPILMIGISIFVTAIIAFFLSYVFGLPSISELTQVFGLGSVDITISILLLWIIPAFILIYLAIKLITRITTRDLMIVGISFLFWLGASAYLTKVGYEFGREYKNKATVIDKANLSSNIDTLYIQIDGHYKSAEPVFPESHLYRMEGKPESWFVLPEIRIDKDSIYKNIEIEIEKTVYSRKLEDAESKASKTVLSYQITDSLFILKPQVYNEENIWNRELFKIVIHCPQDKEVVIENPILKWMEMDKYPERRRNSDYVFTYSID